MINEPTVFVVDDDPAARESVVALARSRGLPTQTYSSAEEFLSGLDRQQRGCLVLDVRMPGMGGLELQEKLAAMGSTLGVILITGYADVPTAVRAMQAGAITFLEKPCTDVQLLSSIEQALSWAHEHEQRQTHRAELQRRLATLHEDERTVLDLLLAGKANKAIAAELDIGLRTVEGRRASIMRKMQAESLAELVRMILTAEGRR